MVDYNKTKEMVDMKKLLIATVMVASCAASANEDTQATLKFLQDARFAGRCETITELLLYTDVNSQRRYATLGYIEDLASKGNITAEGLVEQCDQMMKDHSKFIEQVKGFGG